MRVNKAIVIVIAVLALGWGLGASDKGIKIGVVDFEQAVGATKEGQAARAELDKKQRDAQAELQPMGERYQALVDEYQKKQVVLSPDKLRDIQLDIAELQNRIEFKQQEVQNRLRVDFERLLGPLSEKLGKVVTDVGREQGFSLILRRNTPGMMYAREALDITDLIIEKVNKEE